MLGSGHVRINEFANQNEMKLEVIGSGDIAFNSLLANSLIVNLEGSGKIQATGEMSAVDLYDVTIEGSGVVDTYNVISEVCTSSVDGSGEFNVTVNKTLDAHIIGSGEINYKGQPEVQQSISGSGSVNNRNCLFNNIKIGTKNVLGCDIDT
ncbi:GIN domain-containing protein [Carboxylicivirga marina]|uniref:GIN domain-containing protein n=1 Tax=Carboxylicivirga marina TaxID=2800988 RepID=UPI002591F8F7|nr:DUF2807 domain-containing protein [uncultured Carboxylicivirga sp.]